MGLRIMDTWDKHFIHLLITFSISLLKNELDAKLGKPTSCSQVPFNIYCHPSSEWRRFLHLFCIIPLFLWAKILSARGCVLLHSWKTECIFKKIRLLPINYFNPHNNKPINQAIIIPMLLMTWLRIWRLHDRFHEGWLQGWLGTVMHIVQVLLTG